MKPLFALFAMATSMCTPEVPTVVVTPAKPIALPAECTSSDTAWDEVPDADIKLSMSVRHDRINKDNYKAILSKRHVCRTAINATMGGN